MQYASLKASDPILAGNLNDKVREAIKKSEESSSANNSPSVRKSAMQSLYSSPTKDLVNWLLPSESQKKSTTVEAVVSHVLDTEYARGTCLKLWGSLNDTHLQCAIEMQSVLNDMQALEERLIFEVQDMLRKHIVLESSCFANLQYDIQMLFGVMESVSVEDDLCSYISNVLEETKGNKERKEKPRFDFIRQERRGSKEVMNFLKIEQKPGFENVFPNSAHVEPNDLGGQIPAGEQEQKREPRVFRHTSLFNQIGEDLPPPPPPDSIEIPTIQDGALPLNKRGLMDFYSWKVKSMTHFDVLSTEDGSEVEEMEGETDEERTRRNRGEERKKEKEEKEEEEEEEEEEENGAEEEGRVPQSQLVLASRIDEIVSDVMVRRRQSEIMEEIERQKAAAINTGDETEYKPAASHRKDDLGGEDFSVDFGVVPEFTDFGSESRDSTTKYPNEQNNKRPSFPIIMALQKRSHTLLLMPLVQHKLNPGQTGDCEEVKNDENLSKCLGDIGGDFDNLFYARKAMNYLLSKCGLHNRKVENPIRVGAEEMYAGFKSLAKMIRLVKSAPKDDLSADLLRDVLLVGCFFVTDLNHLVNYLKQGVEVEGHLLVKHLNEINSKEFDKENAFMRECVASLEVWTNEGEQQPFSPKRRSSPNRRPGSGNGKVSMLPISDAMHASVDDSVDERKIEVIQKKLNLRVEGKEQKKVSRVTGQIALVSWCLHENGVAARVIKKSVLVALEKLLIGTSSRENLYSGVENLISTSLELKCRIKERSNSGTFGSSSGGTLYGSSGGAAKQNWERLGDVHGTGTIKTKGEQECNVSHVEGFKKALDMEGGQPEGFGNVGY